MRGALALILLAACAPVARPPAPVDRIAAECALLAQAAALMTAPHPGLREGCPGEGARDTRPLPAQMASLREANFSGWLITETDVTQKATPLESVTISRDYLRQFGI